MIRVSYGEAEVQLRPMLDMRRSDGEAVVRYIPRDVLIAVGQLLRALPGQQAETWAEAIEELAADPR